jgi:lysophospholipase L1-like esterase
MKRIKTIAAAIAVMVSVGMAAQTYDIDMTKPQSAYNGEKGLDFGTVMVDKKNHSQMIYSVKVPDGNYRVKVTFGSKQYAGRTTVYAESRRLLGSNIETKKKEVKTMEWTIHKRSPEIEGGERVKTKEREKDYLNWDEKLTLTFCGSAPAVSRIEISRDEKAKTLFLCGNSTVVDQEFEPWASWGQMLTYWFDENICVANYAESGERTTSFMASKRLDKALSMAKKGDVFFVEFGHNDEKDKGPGSGAWYNFSHNLKTFIDKIREKECEVVLITPTARRAFKDGELKDTHGDYPTVTRMTAEREKTGLIDLTKMTTDMYLALGEEGSKKVLVHYAAGTYPGQDKELADNTHFNTFGAWEVSKCIVMGLKAMGSDICKNLRPWWADFDAKKPDEWQKYSIPAVEKFEVVKPDGN